MNAPERHKGKFSCVVDADSRFHLEALRWFASAHKVAGVDPSDMVIHAVGGNDSEVLRYLREHGVTVRSVDAFDPRSPHCNKISGALSLAELGVEGYAVLTDTDVVLLEDPRTVDVADHTVASKPVEMPYPPLDVITKLFDSAKLPYSELWPVDWHPAEQTIPGNGNGGIYIVPGEVLSQVAQAWARWARWLLDRAELLADRARNVDQVAMAMALADQGIGTQRLERKWNFPTHRLEYISEPDVPPAVIHYHDSVNAMGLILETGIPGVDRQVKIANEAVSEIWHEAFPNSTFWDWRYATNPDLGSGYGSRGQALAEKRQQLASLLSTLEPGTVLDVGCGDGEATRGLLMPGYTGIDVSAMAVKRAKEGRPDGDYHVGTLSEHATESDLVICLDVLIHQADTKQYRETVKALVSATKKALLISGYESTPDTDSPMVHFHEPLSHTLIELAPEMELYPIRDVHGITTFLLLKGPKVRHPRDYGPTTLASVVASHPNPLRLVDLRMASWGSTGFFPDHAPRLWEYPVAADLLIRQLKQKSRIVDSGAGVNPLVPYLAAQGFEVDTVDPSLTIREWSDNSKWTEWGFLDYAEAGMGHKSWNALMHDIPANATYDAAYSISVIEHLPAADRRQLLRDISDHLRPGGLAILTIDLVRGSDDLWNRSQGKVVEADAIHGDLPGLVKEATDVGLQPTDIQRVRDWGDVPVDIGLLVFQRHSNRRKVASESISTTSSQLGVAARKALRTVRSRLASQRSR